MNGVKMTVNRVCFNCGREEEPVDPVAGQTSYLALERTPSNYVPVCPECAKNFPADLLSPKSGPQVPRKEIRNVSEEVESPVQRRVGYGRPGQPGQ